MRDIRFRAWDKDVKGMRDWEHLLTILYHHEHDCFFNDPDFILMQYTGLKDKNGKEIYEGDIVKYIRGRTIFLIVWYKSGFYFAWRENEISQIIASIENFEIIGNIYENPELL